MLFISKGVSVKIQITGVTSNQLNIRRKKNPLFSAAKGLLDYFEADQHNEVINTPELTDADILLYGLYSLNSFVSGGFLKTAESITKSIDNRKVVFFVDDWHIDSIGKNLLACSKNVDGYLRFGEKLLGRKATSSERDVYDKALKYIMNSWAPILVHVLPWLVDDDECRNDYAKALCVDPDRIVLYDPSLFIEWDVPKPAKTIYDKQRQWVVASRYDFSRFVNKTMQPSWPVLYYGCKKIPNANFVPNEVDLVEAAFRPNWGVVSHPYPEHLQGQWRNKFMFSCISHSVILAYGKETRNMRTFLSRSEIEKMNEATLRTLAVAQRNEQLDRMSFEKSSERVMKAIK